MQGCLRISAEGRLLAKANKQMTDPTGGLPLGLDVQTLLVIATWMAALLGTFLLLAWISDRTSRALAWWSTAYVIGGSAVASWVTGPGTSIPMTKEMPSALLFLALGMIWTGARLFYGQRVRPLALVAGAVVWLIAARWPMFAEGSGGRLLLACIGIAAYAFLTAMEIRRDRRTRSYPRWRAIIVPSMHASVFLCPVVLPALAPWAFGASAPGAWLAVLTLATLLYAVGGAFLILALVQDRAIRAHRDAASLDPLTALFNRRAFTEAAQRLIHRSARSRRAVTVLMFDLDHFKSINDRFGHAVGDDVLRLFARIAGENMRADDVIGRLGGEEFAAMVPGDGAVAAGIAERLRSLFEAAGVEISGHPLSATVSIGAAWTADDIPVEALIAAADAALYRAKAAGRNRLELVEEPVCMPVPARDLADAGDANDSQAAWDAGLEVRQTGHWALRGRRLLRAAAGLAGLDSSERSLLIRNGLLPAEVRARRYTIKVP
jgi:diguanylate cyclase (GGDEF)-like protein